MLTDNVGSITVHRYDYLPFGDEILAGINGRTNGMGYLSTPDTFLEVPITTERYQVQIKSSANTADFFRYRDDFGGRGFRKLFFVVHNPTATLAKEESSPTVELVLPARLAAMVVDAGLVSWILAKIR
jgi:hypothetical protein